MLIFFLFKNNSFVLNITFSIIHFKIGFNQSKKLSDIIHLKDIFVGFFFIIYFIILYTFHANPCNYGLQISYRALAFISPTLINAHPGPMAGEMFTM